MGFLSRSVIWQKGTAWAKRNGIFFAFAFKLQNKVRSRTASGAQRFEKGIVQGVVGGSGLSVIGPEMSDNAHTVSLRGGVIFVERNSLASASCERDRILGLLLLDRVFTVRRV